MVDRERNRRKKRERDDEEQGEKKIGEGGGEGCEKEAPKGRME